MYTIFHILIKIHWNDIFSFSLNLFSSSHQSFYLTRSFLCWIRATFIQTYRWFVAIIFIVVVACSIEEEKNSTKAMHKQRIKQTIFINAIVALQTTAKLKSKRLYQLQMERAKVEQRQEQNLNKIEFKIGVTVTLCLSILLYFLVFRGISRHRRHFFIIILRLYF